MEIRQKFNELTSKEYLFYIDKHKKYTTCELTEIGQRKIIVFSLIFNDSWEHEIESISQDELILSDSATTWTYIRFKWIESRTADNLSGTNNHINDKHSHLHPISVTS